jgi:hypothetical protein
VWLRFIGLCLGILMLKVLQSSTNLWRVLFFFGMISVLWGVGVVFVGHSLIRLVFVDRDTFFAFFEFC